MKNPLGCLLFSCVFTLTQVHAEQPASTPLALWYTHPATTWMTEALPIGNGRIGGINVRDERVTGVADDGMPDHKECKREEDVFHS
jgi:hypothetical protein